MQSKQQLAWPSTITRSGSQPFSARCHASVAVLELGAMALVVRA